MWFMSSLLQMHFNCFPRNSNHEINSKVWTTLNSSSRNLFGVLTTPNQNRTLLEGSNPFLWTSFGVRKSRNPPIVFTCIKTEEDPLLGFKFLHKKLAWRGKMTKNFLLVNLLKTVVIPTPGVPQTAMSPRLGVGWTTNARLGATNSKPSCGGITRNE